MKKIVFAAVIFVGLAQPSSAQSVNGVGITIKSVSWIASADRVPVSAGRDNYVTASNGIGYFISSTASIITVANKKVFHVSVKPGMNCVVNAVVNPSLSNRLYITNLSC